MDDEDEIFVIVNGIGSFVESTIECNDGSISRSQVFKCGDDCLECLQDLQRLIRRDHPETRDAHSLLASWNIVKNELIPLITTYRDDPDITFITAKILVMLTLPIDPNIPNYSLHVSHLHTYKQSFINPEIMTVFLCLLEGPLSFLDGGEIPLQDSQMFELILTLFRNLLLLEDLSSSISSSSGTYIHDQDDFLLLLESEHILEMFLIVAQYAEQKREWLFLLLEIFYLIFQHGCSDGHQEPFHSEDTVAVTNSKSAAFTTNNVGHKRSDELSQMLQKENREIQERRLHCVPRHPRFAGSFLISDFDKGYIQHGLSDGKFDYHTPKTKRLKNIKKAVKKHKLVHLKTYSHRERNHSSSEVQVMLENVAVRFVSESFNDFMAAVRKDIEKAVYPHLPADERNYFWVLKYCVEMYTIHRKLQIESQSEAIDSNEVAAPLSAILDLQFFLFTARLLDEYISLSPPDWQTIITCVGAFGAMCGFLEFLSKTEDKQIKSLIARLLLNIFYDENLFLRKLVHLHKTFDPLKQNMSFLRDLVSATDVTLGLIESLSKSGRLFVKKKRKRKKKDGKDMKERDKMKRQEVCVYDASRPSDLMEENEKFVNISSVDPLDGMQSLFPQNLASEEDQVSIVNKKTTKNPVDLPIQDAEQIEKTTISSGTVGIVQNTSSGDNIDQSHAVFQTSEEKEGLPSTDSIALAETIGKTKPMGTNNETEERDDVFEDRQLKYDSVIGQFCHNAVIANYCILLRGFFGNDRRTNEHIFRMFSRISDGPLGVVIFHQLATFRIFLHFLKAATGGDCKNPETSKLVQLIADILDEFFELTLKQKTMFLKVFYWRRKQENLLLNSIITEMPEKTSDIPLEDNKVDEKQFSDPQTKKDEWSEEDDEKLSSLYSRISVSDDFFEVATSIIPAKSSLEIYSRLCSLKQLPESERLELIQLVIAHEPLPTHEHDTSFNLRRKKRLRRKGICNEVKSEPGGEIEDILKDQVINDQNEDIIDFQEEKLERNFTKKRRILDE